MQKNAPNPLNNDLKQHDDRLEQYNGLNHYVSKAKHELTASKSPSAAVRNPVDSQISHEDDEERQLQLDSVLDANQNRQHNNEKKDMDGPEDN